MIDSCGSSGPRKARPRICNGCSHPLMDGAAILVVRRSGLCGYAQQWYPPGTSDHYLDLEDPSILGIFGTEACRNAWVVKLRQSQIFSSARN